MATQKEEDVKRTWVIVFRVWKPDVRPQFYTRACLALAKGGWMGERRALVRVASCRTGRTQAPGLVLSSDCPKSHNLYTERQTIMERCAPVCQRKKEGREGMAVGAKQTQNTKQKRRQEQPKF